MKFDVVLMNPPYDGDLHLDFFNRTLDNLAEDGKVCIVEPGQWLVQLKNNGKYTKEKSKAYEIKNKIAGHVKDVELQNLNKEFNIANKTVCSIVTVDYSKDYSKIDINCCGDISQVNSIYDCNLIGDYATVKSILDKCRAYKDHMIDHCINTRKYKEYEGKGYWFLRYGNYMLNNIGHLSKRSFSECFRIKGKLIDTLDSFYVVGAERNGNITKNVYLSKSGNPSDSVYGKKQDLLNWYYFIYNNKLPLFVNICLTIDENNNSREYLPWLVDKKYTDEEIYKLLNINKEEQEFISSIINKFDRNSQFGKNYFGV